VSYAITIIFAVLLGFLAGLLSFKVKTRWCSTCGAVKSCPTCAGWAKAANAASIAHSQIRPTEQPK
jgi:hypothetical protein